MPEQFIELGRKSSFPQQIKRAPCIQSSGIVFDQGEEPAERFDRLTFGQAQKWLNMAPNYVVTLGEAPLPGFQRHYPTRRLLTTLRFPGDPESGILWRLLRTGAMLREHAHGRQLDDLITSYGGYEGDFEGRLKPAVIWLLNSLAQICTGTKCYKLDFLAIRAYELMQDLVVGGSLGKLLAVDGIGIKSIDKVTIQTEAGDGGHPMKVYRSTSNRLCPCLCMVSR